MKYKARFPLLLLVNAILFLALGCADEVISLTDIAAHPQPYIGKAVTTEGYVHIIGTHSFADIVEITNADGEYNIILAEPLPFQAQDLKENDYIRVKGTIGTHNLGEVLTCVYLAPQSLTKITAKSTAKGLSTVPKSKCATEAISKLNIEELSYLALRDNLQALQELGRKYAAGEGVEKNELIATECNARAAALGRPEADGHNQGTASRPETLILFERQRLTEANAIDNTQQLSLKELYHQGKRLLGKPVTVTGEICTCFNGCFYISNKREYAIINAVPQVYQLSNNDIVEVNGFVSGIFTGDPIIEPVSIKLISHSEARKHNGPEKQHFGSQPGQ